MINMREEESGQDDEGANDAGKKKVQKAVLVLDWSKD
jgi:hypothetical protein